MPRQERQWLGIAFIDKMSEHCIFKRILCIDVDIHDQNITISSGRGILQLKSTCKAARLAATKHQLLSNPNQLAPIINARIKPISRELVKATKQLRQFHSMGVGGAAAVGVEEGEEEEWDLVTGPVEQCLKRMIKGSPSTPKPQLVQQPSTSKGKASAASTSTSLMKKPASSKYRERLEQLHKELTKPSKPKGKREVESLKPLQGWEDWAKGKQLRWKLENDDDDED
ncbi:hypothetical protein OS493_028253 [Desmophyllum pertusum]|uniref:Uncharacterized protein n=1 Tax=Desmophyllum pertusum TaxID=174260 RepID=A0A9W9YLT5_9CNID|nr:hypothetical protein OS493_028253 [Desmophyllum pertusum]